MILSDIPPIYYAALITAFAVYIGKRRKYPLPLPPGPKKLPLVGNIYDIPKTFEWETYAQWSKVYDSDILHLEAAGKSIIIANSLRVATDLFEKRGAIYSSRSRSPMIHDLIGSDWFMTWMAYDEPWKARRSLFQKNFHPSDTSSYQPKEMEYTHKLLKQLLQTPENFSEHIRHAIGAIAMTIAYGIDIKPTNDPNIEIAEQALLGLAEAAVPGAFLVDTFPLLKHVPSWLPGASFKRKAAYWRTWVTKLVEVPFEAAQKAISNGSASPSFVSACLDDLDAKQDVAAQKRVIMDTAGGFFLGGADTSVSSMNTFMLMMTCHPAIQAKAHEELDRVLGKNALPDFNDQPSLPYISAILKETLRFHTVAPLGVPHCVTEDDEYNGYFIPKNSIVMANAWAILHNEDDYPNPMVFRPERFLTPDGTKLDPNVRDPSAAFGFGRRVCPGQHMANTTLFIGMASILAMFDISKATDENGKIIEPTKEFYSSMLSHPKPFRCKITPRSAGTRKVVMSL